LKTGTTNEDPKPINLLDVSSSSGSESDSSTDSNSENVSKQVTDWFSLHYEFDKGTNVKLSSIFDHYKKEKNFPNLDRKLFNSILSTEIKENEKFTNVELGHSGALSQFQFNNLSKINRKKIKSKPIEDGFGGQNRWEMVFAKGKNWIMNNWFKFNYMTAPRHKYYDEKQLFSQFKHDFYLESINEAGNLKKFKIDLYDILMGNGLMYRRHSLNHFH